MSPAPSKDDFLPTRSSLLSRLRHASDAAGWREFVDNYGALVFQVCRRSGLQRQEAEEVVQETMTAVARQMPLFRYDRDKGSFKAWLGRVTRNHIADYYAGRSREAARRVELPEAQRDAIASGGAVGAGVCEEMEVAWESEWRQHILDRALRLVHGQFPARAIQIFQLSTVQGWSVEQIAAALSLSRPQIYLARHRVGRVVKQEIARLRKELE